MSTAVLAVPGVPARRWLAALLITASAATAMVSSRSGLLAALGLLGIAVVALSYLRPAWGAAVLTFALVLDVLVLTVPLRFVVLAGAVAGLARRREPSPDWRPPVATLVLYGCVLVAAWATVGAGHGTAVLVQHALDVVLVVAILFAASTSADVRRISSGLVAGAVLLVGVAALQFATQTFHSTYGGLALSSSSAIHEAEEGFRAGGPFGDPNFFAQVLVIALPFGVVHLAAATRRSQRAVGVLALAAIVAGVVLTFSRGGFVALAVVVALAVAHRRPRPRAVVAAVAVIAVILAFLPPTYSRRLTTISSAIPGVTAADRTWERQDVSIIERSRVASTASAMFLANPVLGVGPDRFRARHADFAPSASQDVRREPYLPHNSYLQIGAETGALGLVAAGTVVALPFRRRRGAPAVEPEAAEHLWAARVAIVGYLTCALFLHFDTARFLWVLVALAHISQRLRAAPSTRTS